MTKTPKLVAAMPQPNNALRTPMRGAANTATAWHHSAAAIADGKRKANSLACVGPPNTSSDAACSQ